MASDRRCTSEGEILDRARSVIEVPPPLSLRRIGSASCSILIFCSVVDTDVIAWWLFTSLLGGGKNSLNLSCFLADSGLSCAMKVPVGEAGLLRDNLGTIALEVLLMLG